MPFDTSRTAKGRRLRKLDGKTLRASTRPGGNRGYPGVPTVAEIQPHPACAASVLAFTLGEWQKKHGLSHEETVRLDGEVQNDVARYFGDVWEQKGVEA